MEATSDLSQSMPVGIVIRRLRGQTRWAQWVWKAVAVLPGAPDADWKELRREGEGVEYHAATLPLTLYRSDTESYLQGLSDQVPALYVIMREPTEGAHPLEFVEVTASPYEAQDYADTGEEMVEKVPMPDGLVAWIRDFIALHHEDEVFIKRKRDRKRTDLVEDGVGDSRISQLSDVYRAPGRRKAVLQ